LNVFLRESLSWGCPGEVFFVMQVDFIAPVDMIQRTVFICASRLPAEEEGEIIFKQDIPRRGDPTAGIF
jgi:hypothetical protein